MGPQKEEQLLDGGGNEKALYTGQVPVALLICGPKRPEMLQGRGLPAPGTCPQAIRESLLFLTLGSKADCTGGMGNA